MKQSVVKEYVEEARSSPIEKNEAGSHQEKMKQEFRKEKGWKKKMKKALERKSSGGGGTV